MNEKSITKKHAFGCGVACVVYLLEMDYENPILRFNKPENAWQCWYMCKDLVDTLGDSGKSYKYCPIKTARDKRLRKIGTIV